MQNLNIKKLTRLLEKHARFILILIFLILLSGGIWFHLALEKAMKLEIENKLTAIATLKAEQIKSWRQDQIIDAGLFSPFFQLCLPRYLADPSDENRRSLLIRLQGLALQHDFNDIVVLTHEGREVLNLSGTRGKHQAYKKFTAKALAEERPVFMDLHRDVGDPMVHSSVVAPIFSGEGPEKQVIGALVLITHMEKFLGPLIQSWPTPDKTAETLLFRQEDDMVVFLSNARNETDSALNLKIPLSETTNTAVMAVTGATGFVEGKDYRGKEVVSVLLPLPGSSWHIEAKIDKEEAFAEWDSRSDLMILLILGFILFLAAIGLMLRQRELKCHFETLYHSELALRATTERHGITLRAIGDGVISTDAQGRVELMNPVAEELTGQLQLEALGKPLEEVFHVIGAQTRTQKTFSLTVEIAKAERPGYGTAEASILVSKNGQKYRIVDSVSPIRDIEGHIVGQVLVFRDMTDELETKEKLAQAQKLEAIGTLAGGIAHDFNNILFPIIGHTEMLMEDFKVNDPTWQSLNEIYTAAMRAKELVSQILAFSRQEKNELLLIKIQPIVKEALKLIRSTIPTTITIHKDIRSECGAIKADPTQIHQIIMNLCTNAYHAMPKEGGKLRVGLRQIELEESDIFSPDMTPGPYGCLTVADNGSGIPKDIIHRIFEPFFTTKEMGKGTGMGLSVVHGIVKAMNGTVRVYSEPGQGTEVSIYLPIMKSFPAYHPPADTEPLRGGHERILLVDDEKEIILMEKQVLERLGYHVDARTSSIEALEALKSVPDRYDLVITDMAMPGMAGDKLAGKILDIRPKMPILICTGFSEALSPSRIASLGVAGVLYKPILIRDLARKIRRAIDPCDEGETAS